MNPEPGTPIIRTLLARVRARWRSLIALRAIVRAALAAAGVMAIAVALARWTRLPPAALAALGAVAFFAVAALVAWALWPVREVPSDARVAPLIHDAHPSL